MTSETVTRDVVQRAPPTRVAAFWRAFSENRGAVVGLIVVCLIVLSGVFAPLLTSYNPLEQYRDAVKLPPIWAEGGSWSHVLGTDPLGRDMWARLIYGSRLSIFIGLSVMLVSTVIGVALGLIAARVGGLLDTIILRLMDLIMSIPDLVFAIMIIAV
ncbi:MAG TPA: dipeptide ABC transporter permease DppC, partial [Aestuariivirga sp.]